MFVWKNLTYSHVRSGFPIRSMVVVIILFYVALGISGCGGSGPGGWAGITPSEAQVIQLASAEFEARSIGASIQTVVWNLREGAPAGSISPHQSGGRYFATYAATNQAGVFHLDATITVSVAGGSIDIPDTAIITVP